MRVSIISNEDGDLQYSEYIQRHPHSTVYHTLWWRDIIQNEYRFQPVYLLATESGKTVGVMPCFFINNLTGRKLVSVPCSQFGGDLSNDFTVTRAFLSFIEDNQSMIGFSRAAIRFNRQLEAGHESWDIRQHTVMCSINTDSDFEQIKRGFSRNKKRTVTKASEHGLYTVWCSSEHDLREIYNLEVALRRRQGVPVFSFQYLKQLTFSSNDGNEVRILATKGQDGNIVAAELFFQHKDRVLNGYSVTHPPEYDKISPITLTQWKQIEYCANETGIRSLLYGTNEVSDKSIIRFKEKWGAKVVPISSAYFPKNKRVVSTSKKGRLYRWFRAVNRKVPLFIYPYLGKHLIRSLA